MRDATRVWGQVALNSFGGPAGQIGVMHRLLVEERNWFSERRFLHGLNYSMLLPGPEAQQLATYLGWLLHGVRGGLIAGGLFILPGFVAILILSILYAGYADVTLVEGIFYGIKPAVMAIVAAAVVRLGARVLKNNVMYGIATGAFVAIFFLDIPFPLIIAGAGIIGYAGGRYRPASFEVIDEPKPTGEPNRPALLPDHVQPAAPSARRSLRVLAIGLTIWLAPIVVLAVLFGRNSIWVEQGVFFSTAAVVTFGGAYAVLAYVAQQAVDNFGWLLPGEMLDGLGMAETTPGPLIQVVQFVGFMGAYRADLGIDPMLAGVLAAVLVTWVTFVPCFIWILAGGPYVESLRGNQRLTATLSSITAAVVGVILNLAIWFSLHTLFGQVTETSRWGIRLHLPDLSTLDPVAALIAVLAFLALFRWRWPLLRTIGVCAVLGVAAFVFVVA
jgi:chromate transporter